MVRYATVLVVISVVVLAAAAGTAEVVTFDGEPLGTLYGAGAGDPPGTVVLVEDNIRMSMRPFFYFPFGSGSTYGTAQIIAPPNSLAVNATHTLTTNNVNAVFDFGAVAPVEYVAVQYKELGGDVNFDVNGLGLQDVLDFPSLVWYPTDFAVNVIAAPVPGGYEGLIEVGQIGPNSIQDVLVGGQELGIDNILKTLFGDANLDGKVNGLDVNPFVKMFVNGQYMLVVDMNRDGQLNGLDVRGFVQAIISGAQPVPEPSTIVLAAIGLITVSLRRRRRA